MDFKSSDNDELFQIEWIATYFRKSTIFNRKEDNKKFYVDCENENEDIMDYTITNLKNQYSELEYDDSLNNIIKFIVFEDKNVKSIYNDKELQSDWTMLYFEKSMIFNREKDNKKFDVNCDVNCEKEDTVNSLISKLHSKYPEVKNDDSLDNNSIFMGFEKIDQKIIEQTSKYFDYIKYLEQQLKKNNILYEKRYLGLYYTDTNEITEKKRKRKD